MYTTELILIQYSTIIIYTCVYATRLLLLVLNGYNSMCHYTHLWYFILKGGPNQRSRFNPNVWYRNHSLCCYVLHLVQWYHPSHTDYSSVLIYHQVLWHHFTAMYSAISYVLLYICTLPSMLWYYGTVVLTSYQYQLFPQLQWLRPLECDMGLHLHCSSQYRPIVTQAVITPLTKAGNNIFTNWGRNPRP